MCFQLFLVLLSLSWLSMVGWLLCFLFLRVGSCQLRSALVYALHSTNMYVVKGQLCCPPCPPSAGNVVPTWLCNARIRYPARAWAQIDIPKRYHKLTFLSVTDTYVHTYICTHVHCKNKSLIQSLVLMRSTIIYHMPNSRGYMGVNAWRSYTQFIKSYYKSCEKSVSGTTSHVCTLGSHKMKGILRVNY